MNAWEIYEDRLDKHGSTKRDMYYKRTSNRLTRKIVESLSYHSVTIDDIDQNVAIINSDNLNEKIILSMPGEDLRSGGLVHWMDNYWLITERDANSTIYTRAKLLQCNYLLKWVSDENKLCEQWCVVEDGTKYLTGEYEDRNFVVTRGDSRIGLTIARNSETAKFNRTHRFIIDDENSTMKLAYTLSKPLKVGHVYGNEGVYSFVLQEVVATEEDNLDNMVGDEYIAEDNVVVGTRVREDGKAVWL